MGNTAAKKCLLTMPSLLSSATQDVFSGSVSVPPAGRNINPLGSRAWGQRTGLEGLVRAGAAFPLGVSQGGFPLRRVPAVRRALFRPSPFPLRA